jgi:ribosomal protein L7/L12
MDQFVAMLQVLTSKLVEAEERIEGLQQYQSQGWESSAKVERECAEKDALIAALRADRDSIRKEANEMRATITGLESQVYGLKQVLKSSGIDIPETQETKEAFATARLNEMGFETVQANKVAALKSFKHATGWGLRECKDFLEDWLKPSVFERADG